MNIKKCPITVNNEEVTCVRYGDTPIQFTSIHKKADYIYVGIDENGMYFITDELSPAPEVIEESVTEQEEIKQDEPKAQIKSKKKKTTKARNV